MYMVGNARVGDGFSEVFAVGVSVQPRCPQSTSVIVPEDLSREFRTDFPCR